MTATRARRWLLRGAAALGLAALGAIAAAWLLLRASLPPLDGRLEEIGRAHV
mgnify:CR=1 FL=1